MNRPASATPALAETPDTWRLQAWAFKDRCYAAWSTEPSEALAAAQAMSALATQGTAYRSPDGQPLAPYLVAELQALAAWTAGIAHVTQGRLPEAVVALDQAAQGFLAAGLPDPSAQTQVPKVMVLSLLGQHAEAIACATAAQRALRQHGNLSAAGRVGLNLGNLLLRHDDYAPAVPHLREAALLFARLRDQPQLVNASISLADALAALGQFDTAQRLLLRAARRADRHGLALPRALIDESLALLDLARGQVGPALAGFAAARQRYQALGMPQYLAIAEKQLGDAYLELRLLPEALALFQTAVAQFEALALPEEQAWALVQQGRAQRWLGQSGRAAATFEAAGRLFQQQDHAIGQAKVALARAELALATSVNGAADPPAALAWAQQARAGYQRAGQVVGDLRAQALYAQALQQAGAWAEASAAYQTTCQAAQQAGQLTVQQRCLTGLGELAMLRGDAAGARHWLEAAIATAEEQRQALPADELRAAFLGGHLRAYEARLRLALGEGDAADVLWQLERARARALDDRLAAPVQADQRQQRLRWLYRRLQRQQDEAGVAAAQAGTALADELRRTERALLEDLRRQRLAEAEGAAPGDPDVGRGASGWSGAALQASLAPGQALVAYGLLDGAWFAVVVTHTAVQLCRHLATENAVNEALQAVRFQMDTLRHGQQVAAEHGPLLQRRAELRLAALGACMWEPLVQTLDGARSVLVVAPGALAAVPFAALPGTAGLSLALAPSARVAWRGLQRAPCAPRRVLALGEDSRLPHAGREAHAVVAMFEEGLACTGAQASLQALQAEASAADVLHLACHAEFRSDSPRFSALHLHDGPLTVDLVEQLQLRPGLVVLSACETGLAEHAAGDEMVGLARAFLVAGAVRVLATLWPVDDALTARFMAGFYGALLRGAAPAEALQQARAEVRAHWPHPHCWGGFTLVGGF